MSSEPPKATASKRRLHVDALRGLAVLLMMEQHVGVWLWRGPAPGESIADYPVLVAINVLGGGAAPLFITLAGVGASLLASRRTVVDALLVRRGLLILGFGFALSLATPSWFSWRSWFVLHLIGVGTMLAPLFRRVPTAGLFGAIGVTLVITGWGQQVLETPVPMHNHRMAGYLGGWSDGEPALLSGGIWRLAAFEGHFPVFPWLAFYIGGIACGRWIHDDAYANVGRSGLTCLLVGASMIGCGVVFASDLHSSWLGRILAFNVPFFPASPAFVLLLFGAVQLSLRLAQRVETRLRATSGLVVLGRASLTLLILHVVLVREGAHWLGFWRVLPAAHTAVLLVAILVASVLLTRLWSRRGYRFGAEWLLRVLA